MKTRKTKTCPICEKGRATVKVRGKSYHAECLEKVAGWFIDETPTLGDVMPVLRALAQDPHGCARCDYGVLRKPLPGQASFDHEKDCVWVKAKAVLTGQPVEPPQDQKALKASLVEAATDLRQWRRTALALNAGECSLPLSAHGIAETENVLRNIALAMGATEAQAIVAAAAPKPSDPDGYVKKLLGILWRCRHASSVFSQPWDDVDAVLIGYKPTDDDVKVVPESMRPKPDGTQSATPSSPEAQPPLAPMGSVRFHGELRDALGTYYRPELGVVASVRQLVRYHYDVKQNIDDLMTTETRTVNRWAFHQMVKFFGLGGKIFSANEMMQAIAEVSEKVARAETADARVADHQKLLEERNELGATLGKIRVVVGLAGTEDSVLRAVQNLQNDVKFYKEREAHFAKVLQVADGGQYRNDWDAAIEHMVQRLANDSQRIQALENDRVEVCRAVERATRPGGPLSFAEALAAIDKLGVDLGQAVARLKEGIHALIQCADPKLQPVLTALTSDALPPSKMRDALIAAAYDIEVQGLRVAAETGHTAIRDTLALIVKRLRVATGVYDEPARASEGTPKSE